MATGSVRRKPWLAPEAVTIVLFGPGVPAMANAKPVVANIQAQSMPLSL
jgi:hypothetical protein